jgi:uncharacterized membrane protein YhaH (DUF805 family)
MEWMLLPLRRYADFSGRSRRREYWMFTLLNLLIGCVLFGLAVAAGLPLGAMADPGEAAGLVSGGLMMVLGLLFLVWWLAILIPSIAVSVRRLHDRDMSGWWYLGLIVASMIPIIGFLFSIGLLVLMLLPGTPGPNRFGPDPKDPSQAAVFA